jgi:hypothetical protein
LINSKYVTKGFNHLPGVHCTSSAVRNVFEFHGYKMSESMIFGQGSGMGLAYINFRGMKNPIIGGRSNSFVKDLCKILDIKLNILKTSNANEGWLNLKKRLDDNIATAINMDIVSLKYRGLPDDYHFGQHGVVVCGHNPEKSSVFIADTDYEEIQEISIEDLTTGRNSTHDKWLAPKNAIFDFSFPERLPTLAEIFPKILQRTGKNILQGSRIMKLLGVHSGVSSIDKFVKDLPKWLNLSEEALENRCSEFSGYISRFGTGGGLFRYLFSSFLLECSEQLNENRLKEFSTYYKDLGDKWEDLSQIISDFHKSPNQEKTQNIDTIMEKVIFIKDLEVQGAKKLINYNR